jgi:hypothetical protein
VSCAAFGPPDSRSESSGRIMACMAWPIEKQRRGRGEGQHTHTQAVKLTPFSGGPTDGWTHDA